MSNLLRVLAVLASSLLLGGLAAAPAGAAERSGTSAVTGQTGTTQARFGGRGFGRSRGFTPRRRSAPVRRSPARRSPFHGLGGAILRGLGIAYLFHMLFGWGAGGGSPFGLLLLLGLMFLVFSMFRQRRRSYGAYRY
jgi:predicted lipid-binding transport protein (Tim44 family)